VSKLLVDEISDADNTGPVTVTDGAVVNRTGDGTIIDLQSGGTTVGSIGTAAGGININSQGGDFAIRRSGTDVLYVGATASYPGTDNGKDLGVISYRWKDLYLSGGVNFGSAGGTGTATSNLLDDYEEGTWTPSVGGTATYTVSTGVYTKVGRLVTAAFDMTIGAIGSGATGSILGLPFAAGGNTQGQAGSVSYWSSSATAVYYIALRVDLGGTVLYLSGTTSAMVTANAGLTIFQNATRVLGAITYQAS
jgi:hypothetical protein